jgi:transcriptional regulator with XRE-family HTH domain
MSLHEFGRRADCDYTTASRLLSGDRSPSTKLLNRICSAFDLDSAEALAALARDQGRDDGKTTEFAAYLRTNVIEANGGPGKPGRPRQVELPEAV